MSRKKRGSSSNTKLPSLELTNLAEGELRVSDPQLGRISLSSINIWEQPTLLAGVANLAHQIATWCEYVLTDYPAVAYKAHATAEFLGAKRALEIDLRSNLPSPRSGNAFKISLWPTSATLVSSLNIPRKERTGGSAGLVGVTELARLFLIGISGMNSPARKNVYGPDALLYLDELHEEPTGSYSGLEIKIAFIAGEIRDDLVLFLPEPCLLDAAIHFSKMEEFSDNSELAQQIARTIETILDKPVLSARPVIGRENDIEKTSTDKRLAEIDDFARSHPGEAISPLIREKFPELFSHERSAPQHLLPLPKRAPAHWPKNRLGEENAAQFAVRVYGEWMKSETISRADIKKLDPKLYIALNNFFARAKIPADLPPDFNLPTLQEANDRWVERVRQGLAPLPSEPEELSRFAFALRRRGGEKDRSD